MFIVVFITICFRRNLLIDVAKHLDCRCVFTPEISEDVAAQLLTNVALGRGFNLPLDIVSLLHNKKAC